MAILTLAAAQATSTAKILRAIKAGRRDQALEQIDPVAGATEPAAAIEHGAAADILVAELRQVIQDLRRGHDDLRQERDHWRTALEREQAAHAATQRLLLPALEREQVAVERLLLPAPATAMSDATAAGEGAPASETRRNLMERAWRWLRPTG